MTFDTATVYAAMSRIRRVEETLLDLFRLGLIAGTTHTCIGQEANTVGVIGALDLDRDLVFSNHRNHGHYLAFTSDVVGLIGEVAGRGTGSGGGLAGSQHLAADRFLASGVQGSLVPVATGAAVAERSRGSGAVTTVFIGDGTLGQGVVYETLNIASLWSLPILFVLEANGYAQSTPTAMGVAGSITDRAGAFGIATDGVQSTDVERIAGHAREAVRHVRDEGRPMFLAIETIRLGPHSSGDDHRDAAEVAALHEFDPLEVTGCGLGPRTHAEIDARVAAEVDSATNDALGRTEAPR